MDIFIVDTSALLRDLDILNKLSFCKIIIHTTVLEELDKLSKRNNSKGSSARKVIDKLFELRRRGNFYNGIKWNNKIVEFCDREPDTSTYLRFGLSKNNKDNLLLCVAKEIKDLSSERVVLLTADKCFSLKAQIDIEVEYVSVEIRKKKYRNKGYYNNGRGAR